jgi:spoIIIJ-associated protein
MSENRSIEEAISRFVESLEEEQKNDKLLESNNTKEKYLEDKVYDFEEQDEEKEEIEEKEIPLCSDENIEKIKEFVKKVISIVANSEVSDINYDSETGKINIYGKDLGIAIGKNGKNMEAIEYITNLYIKRKNLSEKTVNIDIKNYKKKKYESIKSLALKMANKAVKEQKKIILKPMPSYERKIIHDILAENKEVKTKSKNKEPYRRIIIYPLKEK